MNLDISKFKPFLVSDIFEIKNGKGITKEEIENNMGDFIAVQSGEENNGCIGKIDKEYCTKMGYTMTSKPCLTVARSGSAGFVSYQKNGCVVGDSAKLLLLKDTSYITDNVMIFLQTLLAANRFKYTYGRKVTTDKYAGEVIQLPINSSDKVDWAFMDKYIKKLHYKPLTTKNKLNSITKLEIDTWKQYRVGDLFQCETTSAVNTDDIVEGSIPYITRSGENNGVSGYLGNKDKLVKGNCITIGAEGVVAFYQKDDFIPGVKVYTLRNKNMNEATAIFIITLLNQENYKYSYGRARILSKITNEVIKLPSNILGEPDWEFMEKYIKQLSYGDRLQ